MAHLIPTKTKPLNRKQERFVWEFYAGNSATQSAIIAGYAPDSAHVAGSRLLRNVYVQARLAEIRRDAEEKLVANPFERRVILSEIARGKIGDYVLPDGTLALTEEKLQNRAIQRVKNFKGGKGGRAHETSIELHNPVSAIQELNKMDGVYSEQVTNYSDVKVLVVRESKPIDQLVSGEEVRADDSKQPEANPPDKLA